MINGWEKSDISDTPESKLKLIHHIMRNWKVAFHTDRQALHEIEKVLKSGVSNISELTRIEHPVNPKPPKIGLIKFRIVFDGGTPCNVPSQGYGIGYGSYKVNNLPVVRCDHRLPMSANCAEIMTLVEAIRSVASETQHSPAIPRDKIHLDIWGDSQIAVNWANGVSPSGKPCKLSKGSSKEFGNAVQTLRDILKGFGYVQAQWHSRTNSVRTFGH